MQNNIVEAVVSMWTCQNASVVINGYERPIIIHWSGQRKFEVDGNIKFAGGRNKQACLPTIGSTVWVSKDSIGTKEVIWGYNPSYQAALIRMEKQAKYKLVLRIGTWEGRDFTDPVLIGMYNPTPKHTKFRPNAEWFVSFDDGNTWKTTDCPRMFSRMFEKNRGTLKVKKKKAA